MSSAYHGYHALILEWVLSLRKPPCALSAGRCGLFCFLAAQERAQGLTEEPEGQGEEGERHPVSYTHLYRQIAMRELGGEAEKDV